MVYQGAMLSALNSDTISIIWLVVFFAFLWFFFLRPQRKQKEETARRLAAMEVGDSVRTSAGFIGVVIDIDDEDNTVIVEFGNNRNCRIPMLKDAIVEIEKPEDAIKPVEVKESKRSRKKKEKEQEKLPGETAGADDGDKASGS